MHTAPTQFARSLRRNSTEVERRMWAILRDRRFADHKFRRQVPIGPYVADFACFEAKLVVELDGSQHFDDHIRDELRDAELSRRGFTVIRVWNSDVNGNPDGVLQLIFDALSPRVAPPSSGLRPPSPIEGEGEPAATLPYQDENP